MAGKLRLTALFLIVVGARFWLVHRYAVSMPYWDQWDAEGAAVLKPWLEGTFHPSDLLAPHNEHRIVLTRLLTLAIFAANGQWDGLVEMAVNAVFCGGSAVCVAGVFHRALRGRFPRTVLAAVGLYFVLPFGWENTLCGFQSQVYFLTLFSLLALWGLGTGRPGSRRWWIGAAGGVLACLSMASGLLAPAAVLAMLGARLALQRRLPDRGNALTAALCLGLVVAGGWSRTTVEDHAVLQAESVPAFAAALVRLLAWPSRTVPSLAALAVLPLGLVAVFHVRGRGRDFGAGLLLGIGGWTGLQAAALAYGRGGHGALPGSRYTDLLALVPLTGFMSWLLLIGRASRFRWRVAAVVGLIVWTIPLATGLYELTVNDFDAQMPDRATALHHGERNVRGYVATHDFARFLTGDPESELPYPNAERLAMLLDDATLRPILPADIRAPLAWQVDAGETGPFVPDGYDPACGLPPGEGQALGSWTAARGGAAQGVLRARFTPATTLPYLRLASAGALGESGLEFSLRDPASGRQAAWHPVRVAGARWRTEYLPNPGGDLSLLATDGSSTRWFAFSAPVEVGRWSRWTGFLLRTGPGLLLAGLLLAGGLEVALLAGRAAIPPVVVRSGPPDRGAAPLRLLSVVIPARDEEGCIVATVEGFHTELRRAGVPHEIVVVDDGSTDGTWTLLGGLGERVPEVRPLANRGPHGFGCAVVHGLEHMSGDAVVIVMADASDLPEDAVRYWHTLQEGYDCVFGSRFMRGGRVVGYPWFKRLANRLANRFIRLLFGIALDDTTNAFKAYRREVIDGCRPLISPHFNLTVELPLKAIVRGFRWTVIPITWRNRRSGAAKFKLKEMGSRYLFICLSIWLEKHFSRGDYRRPPTGQDCS